MGNVSFPQIQITQQYGRIGIDADPGRLDIQQPKATQELATTPAKLEIDANPGILSIDNSRWHDALGQGPSLEAMNRIYSGCRDIALQGIEKIVEEGNRLAAIHTGENVIAALATESTQDVDFYKYMYIGEASLDNIDIRYEAGNLDVQFEPAKVEHNVTVNPPIIEYHRGKLEIYMLQYPKVEITPPQMDLKI
ncbi:DUF6470 family protein [Paenibacillus sp. V4I5]|uniref:DUF6470 family protein n=1 Tax=Paenibacillus sp. V4I5 TaxID=3042306 RepID=UPI002794FA1F|nr:DUF6470 family protein [Paenibacillus sp. V4I5]MDQ0918578.1 hypothetical protein [Paenibacillus sp. V4I5]